MRKLCTAFTFFELIAVVVVLLLLIGSFGWYAHRTLSVAREVSMRNELTSLRMSIELYRVLNGVFPQRIEQLFEKSFTLKMDDGKIISREYLKPCRVDRYGQVVDPFLHRFGYDPRTGRVWSQTKGYSEW